MGAALASKKKLALCGVFIMQHFEIANGSDPAEIAKAVQRALIASMKNVLQGFKQDIGGPGLTWTQIDFFLDEFAKKEPTVITQERELIQQLTTPPPRHTRAGSGESEER